ncbi:hypothetical protein [Streptomyces sp. KS 21]|uniref:hypothetical protein n=1 Tax=Streptomyces sp. KS 21 TaxID=2485150 RepID=UPI00106273A5|nr:hypothetical protein [Streptomyces sp. KS 21]TDU67044.1 hypothetical protein EDD91_8076 [Streptomyces sp. KS 21]
MSADNGWESGIGEGSVLRVREVPSDPNDWDRVLLSKMNQGCSGKVLPVIVRSLDLQAGTAVVALLNARTGEPVKLGEILPDYWRDQGLSEPSSEKEREAEFTATIKIAEYPVVKVIDEWPWQGVYLGDYITLQAPPLGSVSPIQFSGTVTKLDEAKQTITAAFLDRIESFLYERTIVIGNDCEG